MTDLRWTDLQRPVRRRDSRRMSTTRGSARSRLPLGHGGNASRPASRSSGSAVGSTFAFALLLSGLAAEIVLIDANERKAEGEAMDLMHAVPFANRPRVGRAVRRLRGRRRHGDRGRRRAEARRDAPGPRPQERGDLRPDRAQRRRGQPDGIILVATNPVDVLTLPRRGGCPGLPPERVIGVGHDPRHGPLPGCCWRTTTASIRARSTPSSSASTATPRCRSGARRTSPGCRLREFGSANGDRLRPGGAGRIFDRHPRRGLPDHRAQGRHVLRRRRRAGADRRGDPARPAHGAVGELADPRLLRDRRRLPVAADGDPPRGRGPRVANRPVGRRVRRAARVGATPARDDRIAARGRVSHAASRHPRRARSLWLEVQRPHVARAEDRDRAAVEGRDAADAEPLGGGDQAARPRVAADAPPPRPSAPRPARGPIGRRDDADRPVDDRLHERPVAACPMLALEEHVELGQRECAEQERLVGTPEPARPRWRG